MSLKVVILAAGKGTRMKSNLPKVLQPLAGKPLLQHVIDTAQHLHSDNIVAVVGHGAELVKTHVTGLNLEFVLQEQQLGTGHAVQQVQSHFEDDDTVLILYGDVPLTKLTTLTRLLNLVEEQYPLALLTITLNDSNGYGRIIRDNQGEVLAIVEQKDANPEQCCIKEVNTGILAAKGYWLKRWIDQLTNQNSQGEYYLTDVIALAVREGFKIATTHPETELEVLGVNDKLQLHTLEREYQRLLVNDLMLNGVTILDAHRVDIRGQVTAGRDVEVDVNVVFEGQISLGDNVRIGANCYLKDVTILANTVIHPFSHLESCQIGEECIIGPYARLRPGTQLANQVKIGNFVETKKAVIGKDSKVNHLSYIGDTVMGTGVNIGAGTITCNYDGVNKHVTHIGNNVFVGSDTQLIAPVNIGHDATIGAGSTITKDVPSGELTLSRSKQLTLQGWKKPVKKSHKLR
ncbi:bifunctional UDP-N-acetylglucosamine diphosphorylase/glucosamine-1-phosphate N-acetyltransferase GlmU [Thiomicrorhabdus aquaedulcis]|uniref:bifunctional UDP-N-acetylglucosamine diphosphorylase/glucosamine-1-phosphate N-acetyltransferase GlmU n=1 Tax=Thiomicrorhabdus aquaedulcis TaxID=2211106 RepID=UPI000FD76CA6|nr:bifunctional UDP-N-acetylglucosamine diphosphorylase/glucosamine-1-phosphate N-acetyltransferase GlmU [Thiomicrorhabdus aquaedulcis]